MTTIHDVESVLGQHLDTSFGLSQFHGHGSWLMCEVALKMLDKRLSTSPIAHALRKLNFWQVYTTMEHGYGTHFPSNKGDH